MFRYILQFSKTNISVYINLRSKYEVDYPDRSIIADEFENSMNNLESAVIFFYSLFKTSFELIKKIKEENNNFNEADIAKEFYHHQPWFYYEDEEKVNPKLNLFRDKLIKNIDETTKDKTLFQDYQQTIKIFNKKIRDMFIEFKNLMKFFYIFVYQPNSSILDIIGLKTRSAQFIIMRNSLKDLCYGLPMAVVLLNTSSVLSVYYKSKNALDEPLCDRKRNYPPLKDC